MVDALGESEVSKAIDWSRWALQRKLGGKSGISQSEAFMVQPGGAQGQRADYRTENPLSEGRGSSSA